MRIVEFLQAIFSLMMYVVYWRNLSAEKRFILRNKLQVK